MPSISIEIADHEKFSVKNANHADDLFVYLNDHQIVLQPKEFTLYFWYNGEQLPLNCKAEELTVKQAILRINTWLESVVKEESKKRYFFGNH